MAYSSVNKRFETSFKTHWTRPALTNYQGETITYGLLAEEIERLQLRFAEAGVQPGDKVALCGKNQSNWTVAFMAALTYGAVPVPLLHEFNPESIRSLVIHSESKILFIDDAIREKTDLDGIKGLVLVFSFKDFSIVQGDKETGITADAVFGRKYPFGFMPDFVHYHADQPDELAIINYTSGTSGFSKGVMIPYRAVACNISAARNIAEPQMNEFTEVLSVLPCAHMYGLMFETLTELTAGSNIHYLSKMPSPKVLVEAFQSIHPTVIVFVPLIMEKVYKSKLKPLEKKFKLLFRLPLAGDALRSRICKELSASFGSEFKETILGGAPSNPEMEQFLHDIGFRYTVGYGMTECGPLITYITWQETKVGACGKAIPGCQIRIDSADPQNIPGEVQVKGENVFLGYYNNPEATSSSFTEDGWFKTGDMAIIDSDGYLFLRGRSKCMILSANGQNIYPEELEASINNFDYIGESLVVDDAGVLTAIIHPDYTKWIKEGKSKESLEEYIKSKLPILNSTLPPYAQIRKIEILEEDFERTPKKSIKRYLYQK